MAFAEGRAVYARDGGEEAEREREREGVCGRAGREPGTAHALPMRRKRQMTDVPVAADFARA